MLLEIIQQDFFQSLTPDTGDPHLTGQINQIVTLFMLSDNMKDMWFKFKD